jgi:hypothetical protein
MRPVVAGAPQRARQAFVITAKHCLAMVKMMR